MPFPRSLSGSWLLVCVGCFHRFTLRGFDLGAGSHLNQIHTNHPASCIRPVTTSENTKPGCANTRPHGTEASLSEVVYDPLITADSGSPSVMLLRRLNASFESVELTTTPSSALWWQELARSGCPSPPPKPPGLQM